MIETRQLRHFVTPTVPVASVYISRLDRQSVFNEPTEATAERIVKALADDDADATTLNTMTGLIDQLPDPSSGYALFACEDQVLAAQQLPNGPLADLARYGAPARVGPLLSWLQHHPAYVLVEPNPTGAELTSTWQAVTAAMAEKLGSDVATLGEYLARPVPLKDIEPWVPIVARYSFHTGISFPAVEPA